MSIYACSLRLRLGDVAVFENRPPVTAAKFINKSSLFILLLGVIRRLELKLNCEQKARIYSSPRHIAKPPVQATPAVSVAVTLKSAYKFKKPIFVFHQK
jgi:hypothetical protein